MELTAHFKVMWRRRWRITIAAVLIAGAVYALSSSKQPVYRAEALLGVSSGRAVAGDAPSQEATLFVARTYAELARTRPVVSDAVRRSGLAISPGAALGKIDVTVDTEVGFVSLSATGPTRAAALSLARGLSQALTATIEKEEAGDLAADLAPLRRQIESLEAELAALPANAPQRAAVEARYTSLLNAVTARELRPTNSVTVVSPARAESEPIAPSPLRDAVLALVAALIVNAELAVVLEAFSDRFSRENQAEEVARVTDLPVLAEVPRGHGPGTIEPFRTLRTNLMFMNTTGPLRTVAIVSEEPGSGKSFCAINLAISAAELELAVALVDGDMRRPVIHERLGLPLSPGLSELLLGAGVGTAVVHPPQQPRLGVVPAGTPVTDPAGLLGSGVLAQVLRDLDAEFIVVDTPAEAFFSDAVTLASQCDVTIVVIDAGSTRRRAARRLVESLRRVNANPIGVVINRSEGAVRSSYYGREKRRSAAPRVQV